MCRRGGQSKAEARLSPVDSICNSRDKIEGEISLIGLTPELEKIGVLRYRERDTQRERHRESERERETDGEREIG